MNQRAPSTQQGGAFAPALPSAACARDLSKRSAIEAPEDSTALMSTGCLPPVFRRARLWESE
jgi:hypothetical protein